jgi:hypothetical protein
MTETLWRWTVTISFLVMFAMVIVHNRYIIDQGKRLKQLEAAMEVYIKETK